MNPQSTRRITLGTTSLRYDLKAAREAASIYNRIAGVGAITLVERPRATITDIVKGPLKKGDLDAYVVFLQHGFIYLDKDLEQADVEKLLGAYLRPLRSAAGGKAGKILDFYMPIVQALLDTGVIEEEEEPEDEDAATENGVQRPTPAPAAITTLPPAATYHPDETEH